MAKSKSNSPKNKTAKSANKTNAEIPEKAVNVTSQKNNDKNKSQNAKQKTQKNNSTVTRKETLKSKENSKVKQPKVKSEMTKNDNEVTKLIKIVLIVTAVMIVVYGITILVTKNSKTETNPTETNHQKAVIQYDDIIIGTMLNKDQDEYYVLIKQKDDNRINEYETIMKLIASKANAPKFYTANLTDSFNKKYLAKEANESSDMSEFRVTGTTLVKVVDGNVDTVYPDYDSIKNELIELSE